MTTRVKTPATTAIRVVKKPVATLSRKVVGQRVTPTELSRATNVAGADLAKDSALSNVSVSRALFLTALGAAGGALAAKLAKKPMGIGAGIGAGVGGVGSVAQNMLGDQDVVESADVISTTDSAGRGGMTVMTIAPKKRATVQKRKQTRKSFLITQAQHDEPIGWVAAVIAHGGVVQAGMMQYIKEHKEHALPYLKLEVPNANGTWERNYTYWTLFTERFMEMPSPVFATCRPPMITYETPRAYNQYPHKESGWPHDSADYPGIHPIIFGPADIEKGSIGCVHWAITKKASAESHDINDKLGCNDDYTFSHDELYDLGHEQVKFERDGWFKSSGIKPAYNIKQWIKYSEGKRRFAGKKLDNDTYKAAAKRYYARQGLSYDAQKEPREVKDSDVFTGTTHTEMVFVYPSIKGVPSYWNQSKQRRIDWMRRLDYFYLNCQWMVWAGEMLRLHSHHWEDTPDRAWADHCVLWGVGTPTAKQRGARLNMKKYNGGTLKKEMFALDYSKSDVRKILKALMHHTPPPCDPRFQGNQIAPPGHPRMMMDIPPAAGSLQCPVRSDEWLEGIGAHLASQATGFDVVGFVVNIVSSIVGSIGGGVASMANTIATTVVAQVIQSIFEMARKGMLDPSKFNQADLVGLVGDVAMGILAAADQEEAAGLLLELEKQGVNFDYAALKAQFSSLGSEVNVEAALMNIQSQYAVLRDTFKWDYLDSAFAGLVSDAVAKNDFDNKFG